MDNQNSEQNPVKLNSSRLLLDNESPPKPPPKPDLKFISCRMVSKSRGSKKPPKLPNVTSSTKPIQSNQNKDTSK